MLNRLSYRFFLPADALDRDLVPVFLRIVVDRKKAELSTGVRIKPLDWDDQTQRCQRNPRANAELTHLANRLLELKHHLLLSGQPITATKLKAQLLDRPEATDTLLHFFTAQVEAMKARPEVARNTILCYNTSLRHVSDFLKRSKDTNRTLKDVDVTWLRAFDQYLATKPNEKLGRPIRRNAINKNHSHLRTILNLAEREELIDRNPYRRFRLKNERTTRSFLSREELDALLALDLSTKPPLERARDIFIFSVYTGLRYSDAIRLTSANLLKRGDALWLRLEQAKTGDPVELPLLGEASRLVAKYAEAGHRQVKGLLLPPISNQKLNANLHELGELAGLQRPLTHHLARHTFATTITLANQVPIEVVSKLLGHRDLATTQIYAKITTDHLAQVAAQLEKRLAGA